jgi:hypothetical protein
LPQDRVDHLPVISPPPTPAAGGRQQRLDPGLGGVGEFVSSDHYLKPAVLDRHRWTTREELRLLIITRIERTYQRGRRQRRLGRLTPVE